MNLLKLQHICLLTVLVLSGCLLCWSKADIQVIDSLKQAQLTLDKADSDTLIVFDVDDTLTYQVNVPFQRWFLQTDEGHQFLKAVNVYIASKENPKEYDKLLHAKRMLAFTDQPIEPIIVSMIKELQNRAVKVIALTHLNTGGMGGSLIPSLPKWRCDKLKEVDIDFSNSFPEQEIIFSQLTSEAGRHPVFYKGILLTDAFTKGEVLGTFLDKINWKPNKVIMFDDDANKIESVQQEMKKRSIPFQGFEYKARDKLPHVFDKAVLEKQLQHLKEYDEFISDEDTRRLLQKESEIAGLTSTKQYLIQLLEQDFSLKTDRLLLRKISMRDLDDTFEYLGDEEVHKYLACPPFKSIEDTREFINSTINKYKDGSFVLVVELKKEKKVIGIISLTIDFDANRAVLGFILNKKYWGKGYMTEAANKMLEFGFKNLNLHRIQAMCKQENKNSQKVLQKIHMLYEGTLREHRKDLKKPNTFFDVQIWAILRKEFRE